MFPNSGKPSLAPLLTRLLGSVISFERQAHEQLGPAQFGPPLGGRIQCKREVVGFGHKMTRTGSGHSMSVTPVQRGATPSDGIVRPPMAMPNCRPANASKMSGASRQHGRPQDGQASAGGFEQS